MKKVIKWAFLIAASIAVCLAIASIQPTPQIPRLEGAPTSSSAEPDDDKNGLGYPSDSGVLTSWEKDGYYQFYTAIDFRDVEIVDLTYNQATAEWEQLLYAQSTSYNIAAIGANGQDRFYIAGMAEDSEVIIEQWLLKKKKIKPVPTPPNWLPKSIVRKELFRGVLAGPILQVEADPEERFLLLLAGPNSSRKVYSFPIVVNSQPSILYQSSTIQALEDMVSMTRFQHAFLGRIWVLGSLDNEKIVFIDGDNNGAFDGQPLIGHYHDLQSTEVFAADALIDTFDRE